MKMCLMKNAVVGIQVPDLLGAYVTYFGQPGASINASNYLTPNEFVARAARSASDQAMGRDAALHGASAPIAVAEPSRRGQMQPAREPVSS